RSEPAVRSTSAMSASPSVKPMRRPDGTVVWPPAAAGHRARHVQRTTAVPARCLVPNNASDNPNSGYVEFERERRRWRLEALDDAARELKLMFQDGTSGKQGYAFGRYLRTGPVGADGRVAV